MKKFILFTLILILPTAVSAETINFKSGKVVEGKIMNRTDDYIEVDKGANITLTYYLDEIDTIDGQKPVLPKPEEIKIETARDISVEEKTASGNGMVNDDHAQGADQIIAQLLELNGMNAWLNDLDPKIDYYVEQSSANKADIEIILKIIKSTYSPTQVKEHFNASLRKYYDEKRFKKYIVFLRTPLGEKITQRRKATERLSEEEQIRDFEKFVNKELSEKRAKMRKDFLRKVQLTFPDDNESQGAKMYGALSESQTLDNKLKKVRMLSRQEMDNRFRGELKEMQNKQDEVISIMEQLIFLDPDDAGFCVSLGMNYQMAHLKIGRSAILLEKAIQLNTDIEQVYHTLGLIYHHWGEWDRAEELFKKTIEMNPKAPGPDYGLGHVYHQKGQLDRAIEHFNRALEIEPDEKNSYGMLGLITAQQGKIDVAKKYLNKAKRLGLDADRIREVEDAMGAPQP